jgi:hypothetical protein
MMRYATTQAIRGKLKAGSWAEAIVDAVDRGEADQAVRPALMIDYMGPSLETTISAIGSGVWLFAKIPENGSGSVRRRPAVPPRLTRFSGWKHPCRGTRAWWRKTTRWTK